MTVLFRWLILVGVTVLLGCGPEPKVSEDIYDRAQEGDAAAQHQVGLAFVLEAEFDDAEEWLRKAADSGHSDSQYELAKLLMQARLDYPKRAARSEAIDWLRKSAEAGNTDAQRHLAFLYDKGAISTIPAEYYEKFLSPIDRELPASGFGR